MKKTITSDTDFRAITVEEAKLWCRIDSNADDTLVDGLILAATQAAEAFTGRAITPATVELDYPACRRSYSLAIAPVRDIVSVEFEDCQGDRSAVADGEFFIRLFDAAPTIVLASTPSGSSSLIVTAEVGYSAPESVPQGIKQAIAVHVGSAYAGREGQDTAQLTFENLLRPLQVGGL